MTETITKNKRPIMGENKKIGKIGEDFAANYLIENRYDILNRNYNSRLGEIDIIARKENTICFIEVKSRRSIKCGIPAESVTNIKQQHIRRTAEYFIMKEGYKIPNFKSTTFRFDVCNIILNANGDAMESMEYIENAF